MSSNSYTEILAVITLQIGYLENIQEELWSNMTHVLRRCKYREKPQNAATLLILDLKYLVFRLKIQFFNLLDQ